MDTDGHKRKLAVILATDVEGYSRLMGADEEATIEEVRRIGFDLSPGRLQWLPYAREEDLEHLRQVLLKLLPAGED